MVAALDSLGLGANHPIFPQLLDAVSRQGESTSRDPVIITESEEVKRIRKGAAGLCRHTDEIRGVPFGTTGKELYRMTGILFDVATLPEIESYAKQAAGYCAKFGVR